MVKCKENVKIGFLNFVFQLVDHCGRFILTEFNLYEHKAQFSEHVNNTLTNFSIKIAVAADTWVSVVATLVVIHSQVIAAWWAGWQG